MLYNKPAKINEMKFDFTDECLRFTWKERDEVNTIDAGMDGEYRMSEMHLKDLHYHAYSKAAWQADGTLKLWKIKNDTEKAPNYFRCFYVFIQIFL